MLWKNAPNEFIFATKNNLTTRCEATKPQRCTLETLRGSAHHPDRAEAECAGSQSRAETHLQTEAQMRILGNGLRHSSQTVIFYIINEAHTQNSLLDTNLIIFVFGLPGKHFAREC